MSVERIGYEEIKAIAGSTRSGGPGVEDLLALTRASDPFVAGSPGRRLSDEWFAEIYERYGFRPGAHLRGIHYRLVVQPEPPAMWDGRPYENTVLCWSKLTEASRNARYLGLVSPDAFVDHRAPPPQLMAISRGEPSEPAWFAPEPRWTLPSLPSYLLTNVFLEFPEPDVGGYDYDRGDQPYLLEVWIEKSTMNDVLAPICRELGMNLVTGVGYMSITAVKDMLIRVAESGKPARIFYISDFDGSGEGMPISVARQAEFWLPHYAPGSDVKLTPIALTSAQVAHYQLPRAPIKDSDRTKVGFEDRHGEGATELDALEELYPGELGRILREAAEPYIDKDLPRRLYRAQDEAEAIVTEAWEEATAEERAELGSIQAEARRIAMHYTAELASIRDRLDADMEPIRERLEVTTQALRLKCDMMEIDLPERPDPEVDPPPEDSWLFDSSRDYFEQLPYYKAARRGVLQADSDEVATRACAWCGRDFESARSDAETCSTRCHTARSRAQKENKPKIIRTCAKCGKPFETNRNGQACSNSCKSALSLRKRLGQHSA